MAEAKLIHDITDTARWVAFYRALENERPAPLFRDPLARDLAGPRGEEIVRRLPQAQAVADSTVVRTHVIDRSILRAVNRRGVRTVIDVAAGFDTRPYRLDLPEGLRWIEVDLPELIRHKEKLLASESALCEVKRHPLDLRDREARRKLFRKFEARSAPVLVVSEGLLAYLEDEHVADLARDLHDISTTLFWVFDLLSPAALGWARRHWGEHLAAGSSEMRFGPAQGPAYFVRHGWTPVEFTSVESECQRLNRLGGALPYAGLFFNHQFQGAQPYQSAIVTMRGVRTPRA